MSYPNNLAKGISQLLDYLFVKLISYLIIISNAYILLIYVTQIRTLFRVKYSEGVSYLI